LSVVFAAILVGSSLTFTHQLSTFTSPIMKRYLPHTLSAMVVASSCLTAMADDAVSQPDASHSFDLVIANELDQPRYTPLTREAMKQYIEQLKERTPRIPLPELTAEEQERAAQDTRSFGYESRLRNLFLSEDAGSGYMVFGGSSNRGNNPGQGSGGNGPGGGSNGGNNPNSGRRNNTPPDPKLSLDYAFKVRLFWIAARANNCQYCLGHQESKLLAAGMVEDDIAALDSDWERFPENERAAFALARRLTLEPHLLSDADINACRPFYSDLQIIEMVGSVAGNNAINRWKEGTGVPQSSGGGNFGGRGGDNATAQQSHSYLTPTSDEFLRKPSKVIYSDAENKKNDDLVMTIINRPELEMGASLEKALADVEARTALLPVVSQEEARSVLGDLAPEDQIPQWKCLLANFPVAGKRLVQAITASEKSTELSPTLQAQINWVVARQDRAWYNVAMAKDQLAAAGVNADQRGALDRDLSSPMDRINDSDRMLLLVAKNLAASPIVLTDKQVTDAVEVAGAKAVTQVINYTAYRAMLNRITEAARLSK
jgi:hypothetical protein